MTNDLVYRKEAIEAILADKIDAKSFEIMKALGDGLQAEMLNMTCNRHAEILRGLPSAERGEDVPDKNVGDMISRQAVIDEINKYILSFDAMDANFLDGLKTSIKLIKENFPFSEPELKAAYEQGRVQGRVEMRTELLMQLKDIVGDEAWKNI